MSMGPVQQKRLAREAEALAADQARDKRRHFLSRVRICIALLLIATAYMVGREHGYVIGRWEKQAPAR